MKDNISQNNTFNAEQRSLSDVLIWKIELDIPRNQRDYSWDERNLYELWLDINELVNLNNKEHFFGSLLFSSIKSDKDWIKKYNILDWQQRITTVLILLSVLYDFFSELWENKLSEIIYNHYRKTDDNWNEYFILNNQNIFFKSSILHKDNLVKTNTIKPSNDQDKKFDLVYKYYKKKISDELIKIDDNTKKITYLKNFRDKIFNLKVIEITVTNEVDWYWIFEILNARWKPLSLSDLLKNWILKNLPNTFPTDFAKNKWDSILKNMWTQNWDQINTFLKHYWIHKYWKVENEELLYHNIKLEVRSNNIEDFLNDLEKKSIIYSIIIKWELEAIKNLLKEWKQIENKHKIKIENILSSFKIFRVSQIRPVLLSLFDAYIKNKIKIENLISYLEKLENFHFLFSAICNIGTNKIEKLLHDYSLSLETNFSDKIFKELIDKLKDLKPDYDFFKSNLFKKGFSNKDKDLDKNRKIIKYILWKIEYYYQSSWELILWNINIEHIRNDDWSIWTWIIWNLLPLSEDFNWKADNKNFKSKISYYEKSKLESVKVFLNKYKQISDWNDEKINERSDEIAKLAYNEIWKL